MRYLQPGESIGGQFQLKVDKLWDSWERSGLEPKLIRANTTGGLNINSNRPSSTWTRSSD